MAQRIVNVGIIGGGLMGREFASAAARWCHLPDAPARPRVVAICSQRARSMEWFTQNLESIAQATTSYSEILANPLVEAVYCAVPHNLHERMYVDTIRAGKHLLGEKPFGIDQRANQAILDELRSRPDLVVRCSSEFPYFPAVQRIIAAIRQLLFGTVLEVECGFLHCSDMDPLKPLNWKRTIAANGEYGCMGDLGMHVLHVPLRSGWMPRNVRAILSNIVTQRPDPRTGKPAACETWDNATLLCEVQDAEGRSFPLTVKTQRIAPGETNTWYVTIKGTRFSAHYTTRNANALETMVYERGTPQAWSTEYTGTDGAVYKGITGGIFQVGFSDALMQMIAAFCHEVALGPGGSVPFACATPQETQQAHAIFTAALKSHAERRVVEL
jgi:predicted dehydrogenase